MSTAEEFLVNPTAPVTTRVQANRELYKSFSKCFKLPYWNNTMCHSEVSEKHNREVSWGTIEKEFNVTPKQLMLVMNLYKKIEMGYVGWTASYQDALPKNKNKARIMSMMVDKEIIKVIYGRIVFNPAINLARHGWSQFSIGCMLVQWMNERLVQSLPPSQHTSQDLAAGCRYAVHKIDNELVNIPCAVKGRVEGVV